MKPLNELTISIQLNKKGLKSAQECEQMIHSDCAVYWNMGPSYCYRVNMENQQTLHESEWCDRIQSKWEQGHDQGSIYQEKTKDKVLYIQCTARWMRKQK